MKGKFHTDDASCVNKLHDSKYTDFLSTSLQSEMASDVGGVFNGIICSIPRPCVNNGVPVSILMNGGESRCVIVLL